jgi:hypothetical protein
MRTRSDPGVAGSADGVGGGGSSACVEGAVLRDGSVVSQLLAAGDEAASASRFDSCSAVANSSPALGSPLGAVAASITNGLDDTFAPATASSA